MPLDWSAIIRGANSAGDTLWYRATPVTRTAEAVAQKNGTTPEHIRGLNPELLFPVNVGTEVKVSGSGIRPQ